MSEQKQNRCENKENELPLKETSILFEKYAIWFWLICLLAAIWFSFLPLIAVSTLLIFISLITIIWKEKSLKNVNPEIELNKTRLFVGEEFHIEASVKNDKWLPLVWLEWEFPKKEAVVWGDHEQNLYTIRLLWLLWYQQVKWTIKGKGNKRGVYKIGQVGLRSGDGFRFTEKRIVHSFPEKLYIYPRLLPVHVPSFRSSIQWQIKGKQGGYLEDPLLVNGIREYEPGDEWRKFNWKASARTGKMLTNVYQPVVNEQLFILFDVSGFVIDNTAFQDNLLKQEKYELKKSEDFEWVLSVIASIAVAYQKQGVSVGFSSNGCHYKGYKLKSVPPMKGFLSFLDQLAEIIAQVSQKGMSMFDKMLYEGQLSQPFIFFCETITNEHYLWYKRHKHEIALVSFYYLNDSDYSIKLKNISKKMDVLMTTDSQVVKGSF